MRACPAGDGTVVRPEDALAHVPMSALLVRLGPNEDVTIVATNEAFQRRVSRSAEALAGRPLSELITLTDLTAVEVDFGPADGESARTISGVLAESSLESREVSFRVTWFVDAEFADLRVLVVQDREREALARSLINARMQFLTLMNDSPHMNYILDTHRDVVDINEAGQQLLGYALHELHDPDLALGVVARDRRRAAEIIDRVLAGQIEQFTTELETRDGVQVVVDVLLRPYHFDGQVVGLYGIAEDITEQRRIEEQLRQSEQRYRALFVDHVDAVLTVDLEGNFIYVNPAFERMVNLSAAELIGTSFIPMLAPEKREFTLRHFQQAVDGRTVQYSTAIVNQLRDRIEMDVTLIPVLINGEVHEIHCVAKDITEYRRLNGELERLAFTHQLTGLPNQNALDEHLAAMVRAGSLFSVVNLDLDRLKVVNDRYGRADGDRLLHAVAQRISGSLPKGGRLFQASGDNFIAVAPHESDHHAIEFASVVEKLFRPAFDIGGNQVFASASIGSCEFPEFGSDAQTLLRRSETAMMTAKERGGHRLVFYRELPQGDNSRLLQLEFALREARSRGEFRLLYQPQVDLHTGQPHGAEALIRWVHPEFGVVSPQEFIPLAERTGLIRDIGHWVLEEACQQYAQWRDFAPPGFTISVNVSIEELYDIDYVRRLDHALATHGVDPAAIVLEVTESIAANRDAVMRRMEEIKSVGVQIAIDDFGTGYSSLQYLKDFPIDRLKIDQSFVARITVDERARSLVRAIIQMAGTFGLETVAEGVETQEQMHILRELQAGFAQGYHVARPSEPEELDEWLRQRA